MKLADVRVVCHEGHKGRERPAEVELDGAGHKVIEILDRWYEGPRRAGGEVINYFKVRPDDGRIMILRYVPLFDRCALVDSPA